MKSIFKQCVVALLTLEARILLRRHQPYIIAITGSVGKTTTKDAIFTALKGQCAVRKSEKSFNSELGVPLTVLGLPNGWNNPWLWLRNLIDGAFTAFFSQQYPEVLVLEAGVDQPGDMAHLTAWLTPDLVVLTRLPDVPVHVEFFASPEGVIAEKMTLVHALKPDGVLIYNADDTIICDRLSEVRQRSVGYARYATASVRLQRDRIVYRDELPVATAATVVIGGENHTLRLPGVLGVTHGYAAAAAVAVTEELGHSVATAVAALSDATPTNGRLRVIPGIKGTTLIDDSYNASPIAVEQALEVIRELKYAKRRIVVLGDMLELGRFSADEHTRIGALLPAATDWLFTVGVRARQFAQGALAHGLPEYQIRQYDDVGRAGRELQQLLEPGDVVLIKGSQGVRLERVVLEVMANPEKAEQLLVRQDPAWQQR